MHVRSLRPPRTVLILSQVFVPDPASVGQHLADVARELARRGFRVCVLTANRGYDNPAVRYPSREMIDGVEVRRLPFSSFGKRSIPIRLVGGTLFLMQAIVRAAFTRGLAGILVSTSPPMCSMAALLVGAVRRVPVTYWVMDINPDQMVALGLIGEKSIWARVFNVFNRAVLRRAACVVTLDRFMAERVNRKRNVSAKLAVIAPWPHEEHLEVVAPMDNPFRKRHNLAGKRVIMYSGNHAIGNPITTMLQAAMRLRDEKRVVFMFVGGGLRKREVEDLIELERPGNVISLPYQPMSELRYSLSAADVHLVSVGDTQVGIVHPCKVYGAMAVARPIIVLGPKKSHAAEIVMGHDLGWQIEHGDVEGAVAVVRRILAADEAELEAIGRRARAVVDREFSASSLCGRMADLIEETFEARPAAGAPVSTSEAAAVAVADEGEVPA